MAKAQEISRPAATPWEVDLRVVLELVRASHRCILEVQRRTYELPDDIRSLDEVQARFLVVGLADYLGNRGDDDTWDERGWQVAGDNIAAYVHNRNNWATILADRHAITVTFAADPDRNSLISRLWLPWR